MSLEPGTRLGPYEIAAQIGAGGMGEVYQATDTKLKRQVAIKVLPESVAADAERLARFQREAEVLAALNHPHIAAIYGLEDADGSKALVMELVEGPTLADRIADGPIPIDEALAIARQIAEALEAAHEQGIIHRDLKPANVKVREDGTVKVLDFGLAKAMAPDPGSEAAEDFANSPTITAHDTKHGIILGTAAYMAPEQARGKSVDKRADVWAFGVVLYEMLTGTRAFAGSDVSEVMASVLKTEPDWTRLPAGLSPVLGTYLRRCLHKDPRQRIPDIAAMRLALDGAFETTVSVRPALTSTPPFWQRPAPAIAAALLMVAAGVGTWMLRPLPPAAPVVRFASSFEDGQVPSGLLNFTADGSALVYVGRGESGGSRQLWRRRWADLEATPIPGTEGASSFVLSPDEREVAFAGLESRSVRVVPLDGGPGRSLADQVAEVTDWTSDGTLYFVRDPERDLARMPAAGSSAGTVDIVTDLLDGEVSHSKLSVLPGGNMGLFQVWHYRPAEYGEVWAIDLDSTERRLLIQGSDPRYASTGHLLFGTREGVLMAAPIDPATAELTGPALPVVEGLRVFVNDEFVNYGISDSGTLAYVGGYHDSPTGDVYELVVLHLDGDDVPVPLAARRFSAPRWSPDGRIIVYSGRAPEATFGSNENIYTYNERLQTAPRQVTFEGVNRNPVWSHDGTRVAFSSDRDGTDGFDLFVKAVDDDSPPEMIATGPGPQVPTDWPSEGLITFQNGRNSFSFVDPSLDRAVATPYLESEAVVGNLRVSPGGDLVAYDSYESGTPEVYVRSFPVVGPPGIVSQGDGLAPFWSPDGGTVYYWTSGRGSTVRGLAAASIERGPPLVVTERRTVLDGVYNRTSDLHPDGDRLVISKRVVPPEAAASQTRFVFVLTWFEELKRLVPVR